MTAIKYSLRLNYSSATAGAEAFVTRLYQVGLGREPEADGLNNWVNQLSSGQKDAVNVVQGVLCSPEYQNKGKSNGEVVNDCYQAMLGRAADEGGYADWVGQLDRGEKTRDQVMEGFAFSPEFGNIMAQYGL